MFAHAARAYSKQVSIFYSSYIPRGMFEVDKECLVFFTNIMKDYHDVKHREPDFKVGDKE